MSPRSFRRIVAIGAERARSPSTADCDFVEIFVDAPVDVCEQRDPKGLYKKARAGEIKEFTGISAPYEAPENPELTVHTDRQTKDESVTAIIEYLRPRLKTDVDVEI